MVIDPISKTLLARIDSKVKEEKIRKAYRVKCPKCKKLVIKETFSKDGCFVCGFKPQNRGLKEEVEEKPVKDSVRKCHHCGAEQTKQGLNYCPKCLNVVWN